jgi:hypothetical protein
LYLLHSGVLHRVTPPRAIIDLPAHQVLRSSSGNLARFAAIRRAAPFASGGSERSPDELGPYLATFAPNYFVAGLFA